MLVSSRICLLTLVCLASRPVYSCVTVLCSALPRFAADSQYVPRRRAGDSARLSLAFAQCPSLAQMQNTTAPKGVNDACVRANPADAWKCMFAQYTLPHITSPIFVENRSLQPLLLCRSADCC